MVGSVSTAAVHLSLVRHHRLCELSNSWNNNNNNNQLRRSNQPVLHQPLPYLPWLLLYFDDPIVMYIFPVTQPSTQVFITSFAEAE